MGKWPALDRIDMVDDPISDQDYERRLKKLQRRLLDLQVHHHLTGGRVIIGIDGWDAAGKGGAIRRVTGALDARQYAVTPVAALWVYSLAPRARAARCSSPSTFWVTSTTRRGSAGVAGAAPPQLARSAVSTNRLISGWKVEITPSDSRCTSKAARKSGRKTRRPPCIIERMPAITLYRASDALMKHRASIERTYRRAIQAARHDIVIACAYFFPRRSLRRALEQAALRGVRVRLLLQGHYEYFFPYHAAA